MIILASYTACSRSVFLQDSCCKVAHLSVGTAMQDPQERRKTAGETSFLPSSKGIVLKSEGAS